MFILCLVIDILFSALNEFDFCLVAKSDVHKTVIFIESFPFLLLTLDGEIIESSLMYEREKKIPRIETQRKQGGHVCVQW